MSKIKAAIIGCGEYGWLHAKVIHNLELFDLYAFVNRNIEKAKKLHAEFGSDDAYFCSDYMQVINDPDIEVVYVCTTHDVHFPIAMAAIEAGKHIFMEKPLAMTVEHCEMIEDAVRNSNIKFFVGHKMRFSKNVQRAVNEMPKPITIIAQMMCSRWSEDFWAQCPIKGGGNVLSQGCHIFDLVTYLSGSEPESLYAEGGTYTHEGGSLIDNIVATMRFKNGAIASITLGDSGLNEYTSKTMIQLYGGDDCINLSNRLTDYARFRPNRKDEISIWPREFMNAWDKSDPEGIYAENRAFFDCIVNDTEPPVGAKQGADSVRMVTAAFKAIRDRSIIHF